MHWRNPHYLGLLLFITAANACHLSSASQRDGRTSELDHRVGANRPVVPPGLTAEFLEPREGDALERGRMTLDQIVASLPIPTYLAHIKRDSPTHAASEKIDPIETAKPRLPLAAQRAYVRARYHWHRRQNFEAMRQLDAALALAPNQPEILRLLGRLYIASGNRIRGAMILKKAVVADPLHMETLFLLAKHELEQSQASAAIVILAHAMDLDPDHSDPALGPLLSFYHGRALERERYDQAAIEQYSNYLDLPARFSRTTRWLHDLRLAHRQRGNLWQAVGDAHHRLGEPSAALRDYQKAAEHGGLDPDPLLRRTLYTQMCLARFDDAEYTITAYIRQFPDDRNWPDVVHYLIEHGVEAESLGRKIKAIYEQLDHPSHLAIVVSQLLEPDDGIVLLRSHLEARPTDRTVFAYLLRQLLSERTTHRNAAVALRTTASAIDALPIAAQHYATILIDTADDPDLLIEAIARLPAEERQRPVMRYINGTALTRAQDVDEAATQFQQAIASDPALRAARLGLAELLIQQMQFKNAEQVLEPIADQNDPAVLRLHVRILVEMDRVDDALQLVNRMLAQQRDDLELLLTKAKLQLKKSDSLGAHRSLVEAVNTNPTAESAYQALFNLYRSPQRPPGFSYRDEIMQKLRRHLPFSRLYRLNHAEDLATRHEFVEAEQLLHGLLNENAEDYPALDLLLQTLLFSEQQEQANALIEQRISENPTDRELLGVAQRFFLHSKKLDRFYQITEQLLLLEENSPQRTILLASFYLHERDEPEKATALIIPALTKLDHEPDQLIHLLGTALLRLDQSDQYEKYLRLVMERFPEKQADLAFEWALFCERQGQSDRAEEIMREQLREDPTHANLNNGLGYAWADQGRNLEEAKKMIQLALDTEPDNSAFLDSMGWVHYKLGDFPNAVLWLKRASNERNGEHSVILDHLGDALYKVGERREAKQLWHRASLVLEQTRTHEDPELKNLGPSIRAKLEAINNDHEPPLAEAPGRSKPDPRDENAAMPDPVELGQ